MVGEGSRLVLAGVGRGQGGVYMCSASNGVEEEGERPSASIRLTVHCKCSKSKTSFESTYVKLLSGIFLTFTLPPDHD